nr:MAG TPA: Helix-turn-helix XRE-family like protein [Caudoviricetes sp.]
MFHYTIKVPKTVLLLNLFRLYLIHALLLDASNLRCPQNIDMRAFFSNIFMEVKIMIIDYALIGMRIRELRAKAKITQELLAELSNLSPVYISNIENNKKKPSLESLIKISNVLGITVDELLTGNLLSHPSDYQTDIDELMYDCDKYEKRLYYEILKLTKHIIRKNQWYIGKK